MQISQAHQFPRSSPAGADHLHARGLGRQGAHHLGGIEQPQVEHGIELVEHHHRVKVAGDGPLGDVPAALGFLTIEAGGLVGSEVFAPAGAHLVDQVGKALLQGLDRGVLVVGTAGSFQEPQQQHPGALALADPKADGAEHNPQGRLAFPFAVTVVDMQLTVGAFIAAGGRADADTPAGAPLGGLGRTGGRGRHREAVIRGCY